MGVWGFAQRASGAEPLVGAGAQPHEAESFTQNNGKICACFLQIH